MSYKAVMMNDDGFVVGHRILPYKQPHFVMAESCPSATSGRYLSSELSPSATVSYHEVEWFLAGDLVTRGREDMFGIYLRRPR